MVYITTDGIHKYLFGHNMSVTTHLFLRDISWSFMGGAVSGIVLLITNILVGRLLGPTEYGKIAIMSTIAQIIIIFVSFGMDRASMRFIAMQDTNERKAEHISTTFHFTVVTSITLTLLYMSIYPFISKLIGMGTTVVLIGMIYGLALSYRQLMENIIRGLEKFKLQAVVRIIESLFILLIFLIVWKSLNFVSSTMYMAILIAVGIFFVVFYLYNIRSYLGPFHQRSFSQQFSFGGLYFLAAVFGVIFNSFDKFLIGKYLNLHELGIYSAYFAASVGMLAQLNTLFGNVFTTTVAKNLNRLPSILKKIDRITIIGFVPLFALAFVSVVIIIKLFGSSYEFRWLYAAAFALLAVLICVYSINASIVQTYSRNAFKKVFYWGNIINLTFIGLYIVIIWNFSLSIAWVASVLIIYNAILIILCKYILFEEGAYVAALETDRY